MTTTDLNSRHTTTVSIILLLIVFTRLTTASSASLCVPGFQCVHGHCISGTTCQCDEGWSGVLCTDQVVVTTTTVSSIVEAIGKRSGNLESTPTVSNGNLKNDNDPNAKKARTDQDRQCIPGFECVHGVCDKGIMSCLCDDGWTGAFCQKAVINTSTATGDGVAHNLTTTTGYPPYSNTTFTAPGRMIGKMQPAEGYGPLPDLSLRLCKAGFECRYGICLKNSISCECQPGWIGVLCHEECPLNCGPHGSCSIDNNAQILYGITSYICQCGLQYSGTNCSTLRPVNDYSIVTWESGNTFKNFGKDGSNLLRRIVLGTNAVAGSFHSAHPKKRSLKKV